MANEDNIILRYTDGHIELYTAVWDMPHKQHDALTTEHGNYTAHWEPAIAEALRLEK